MTNANSRFRAAVPLPGCDPRLAYVLRIYPDLFVSLSEPLPGCDLGHYQNRYLDVIRDSASASPACIRIRIWFVMRRDDEGDRADDYLFFVSSPVLDFPWPDLGGHHGHASTYGPHCRRFPNGQPASGDNHHFLGAILVPSLGMH